MTRRVVITGMGAVTPIGNTVDEFWNNAKLGKHGIGFIDRFDTSDMRVKIGAQLKDFNSEKYISKKEEKRFELYSQYAIAATAQAVEINNLENIIKGNDRAGVIIGSGIGGITTIEEEVIKMYEKGPKRISPLFITSVLTNMAAGNVSIRFGTKGICSNVVTACSTASHCIGDAFRNIKHNYADIIISGGSESPFARMGIGGFDVLKTLTRTEDINRASIPFDKERKGFVAGEGAGILVLEELEHAKQRGAKIYAEIVGYGSNADAYHMTSPDPTGEGAAKAMLLALEEGNVSKGDVTYINAHGTSTKPNDLVETIAIKKVFGDHAYDIPITSTKSMTGHLLGATGAIEAIACIKSLEDNFIHPTVGLEIPDEDCDLNYIPKKGIYKTMKYAISNSFGFGGHNAVLCFKKWED